MASIWTLPITVLLIVAVTFVWFSYDEKEQAIELEFRALESNDRIAEALISGLLRNIEQMLSGIAREQATLDAQQRKGYDAVLAERMSQFPEIRSLVVINAAGRVELSASPKLKGFDSSQRDYFLAHRDTQLKPNFYISRPFRTATGNDMSIAFSVAIRDDDGMLKGMVVSGVDPHFFDAVLGQTLPNGEDTTATLFNRQGDVIYRLPNPERFTATNVAGAVVLEEHLAAKQQLTRHIGISILDGIQRMYSISRLGTTGLSVAVSRPYDDALTVWRRNLVIRALIFVLIAAVTLGLAWLARRRLLALEHAESTARREKQFADDIIDSLPGVFYMLDSDGGFIRWNDNLPSTTGYSDDALQAMSSLEVIAAKHREQVADRIHEAFRCGAAEAEAALLTRDGRTMPYHFTGRRIRLAGHDYLIGLGNDISARQQAEEELRLAASIFESSSEGMLISDAENRIVALNPAFTRMTGYTLDDLQGKNPRVFKSDRHDENFYRAMWDTLLATGEWSGEIWDRHKDGRIVAKRLTINVIRASDGSVNRYIALSSDITDRKAAEEIVWRHANFDELTGLPNRRLFHDRLQQEMKKTDRNGQMLALLFIDLDNFKEVNDTRGHQLGDRLLQAAAQRITTCVRDSDTVARLGGDEFTIVLSGVTDTLDIERAAQAILQTLTAPFTLDGEDAFVSASIGITLHPADANDAETLIKNADQAMYAAKDAGRNRYCYFVPALQETANERQYLLRELRGAIAAGQLSVHFQPIVELSTRRIHKAEALVRWKHPLRGMIAPLEFIPLAEETGLIHEIGEWVFHQAAATAKRWLDASGDAVQISVNKSPRQFVKGQSGTSWVEYLGEIGLPPACVAVEITEGLLLDSRTEVTDMLSDYRDNGVQISLDDFGTGYSAMAYLKKFPIDFLKIDKSFVRDMAIDPNDQAIVEAIIVMAHKLGLKVVAEGVETEEQRAGLVAAGCDYAQGYLFAKPMPAKEFLALVASQSARVTS